jgi:hypothetical protein
MSASLDACADAGIQWGFEDDSPSGKLGLERIAHFGV